MNKDLQRALPYLVAISALISIWAGFLSIRQYYQNKNHEQD